VFLACRARRVTLIARRPLDQTMSQYLVERIEALPNVDVVTGCEIASLEGKDGALEAVSWRDRASGAEDRRPVTYLFSFIGAEPNTDWLAASGLKLDPRGFVLTGEDIGDDRLPLETSRRGVFAVGDVRSNSVKRVAAAVGDGAQVVAAIHKYRAESPALATAGHREAAAAE
jgi:thioredoxin reductase (NADPH)